VKATPGLHLAATARHLDLPPGGQALGCPLVRGMEMTSGLNLTLYPNRGSKALSAKLGALFLNAWNSEKIIAFFENPLLLFRLKVKKFQSTVFSQPTPGWRIISTN
jgi:hypothetical protein